MQHQRGHLHEAIACYQQVIEQCPESHLWVYRRMGDAINEQASDSQELIAQYSQDIEREPECFWLHYLLGEVLARAGRMEQATASYWETIRLNPNFLKPYYKLWEIEPDTAASQAL